MGYTKCIFWKSPCGECVWGWGVWELPPVYANSSCDHNLNFVIILLSSYFYLNELIRLHICMCLDKSHGFMKYTCKDKRHFTRFWWWARTQWNCSPEGGLFYQDPSWLIHYWPFVCWIHLTGGFTTWRANNARNGCFIFVSYTGVIILLPIISEATLRIVCVNRYREWSPP